MRRLTVGRVLATLVFLPGVSPAVAGDVPLPGKLLVLRSGRSVKVIARDVPPSAVPAPGGVTDPTLAASAIYVSSTGGGFLIESLPPAGWRGLGSPAGARGYRYRGDGTPSRPFRVVVLRPGLLKMIAGDAGTLGVPMSGDVDVELRLGAAPDADSYCVRFGGAEVANTTRTVKRIDAPAPLACTPVEPCCGFARYHSYTAEPLYFGTCGEVRDRDGFLRQFVYCGGLRFGGGDSALGITVPFTDVRLFSRIVSLACTDNLGPTTAAETGRDDACTSMGCRFGAPMTIVADSPEQSVCITVEVAGPASGSLDCATGQQTLDLPLTARLHLTGDAATDPAGTIPGTHPCPTCLDGTCVGGPNAGRACSSTDLAKGVTADCPPDPEMTLSTIPVLVGLSSGTVTWTATASGGLPRNFVGYCQDADGTGAFEDPPNKCLENGVSVGAGCGATFESCRQRTAGAFGPNGRINNTITTYGDPQDAVLTQPSFGMLSGIFAVQPTYDELVDLVADLPGPGVAGFRGMGELCMDAMNCP